MSKILYPLLLLFVMTDISGYATSPRFKVLASASMIADIASAIGDTLLDIDIIVPIGGDPHLYEPTPRDVRKVAQADLILLNGLTFEGWINELIQNSGTKATSVTLTNGIDVLTSQTYKNSSDPHAWMTAKNGMIYAENIKNAFVIIDPDNENIYIENFKSYHSRLEDLEAYIQAEILKIPEEQRILITSHDAFQYYGKQYGIRLEAIMGISTEAEAQTSDIIRVNRVIREFNVPALFVESTINPKLIEQLATDNQISIGGKLYADSLGDEQSPANTYINMLKYNTDTIVKALSSPVTPNTKTNSPGNLGYLLGIGLIFLLGLFIVIHKLNK